MKKTASVLLAALAFAAFSQIAVAEDAAAAPESEQPPEQPAADQAPDKGKTSGKLKITKDAGTITAMSVDSHDYGLIEIPQNLWKGFSKIPDGVTIKVDFEKKDGKLVVVSSGPKLSSPLLKKKH